MGGRIVDELSTLKNLSVQRCYLKSEIDDPFIAYQLHGFSDASPLAYGACIYLRAIRQSGSICCSLVTSKSRVAPLKSITLPRLKLMGNLILARLFATIYHILNSEYEFSQSILRIDSQITLAWIKSINEEYKVFVENCVQEIRKLTNIKSWEILRVKDKPYRSNNAIRKFAVKVR